MLYLTISILVFVGIRYGDLNVSLYLSSFLSIPSIMLTILLFIYIKQIRISEEGKVYYLIKNISSLSFGIYLSHMVIYSCFTMNLYHLSTSWIMQIFCFILTFLGGWLLSSILSRLPFSKYIIGV